MKQILKLKQSLATAEAGEKKRTENLEEVKKIDEQVENETYELRDLKKACEDLQRRLRETRQRNDAKVTQLLGAGCVCYCVAVVVMVCVCVLLCCCGGDGVCVCVCVCVEGTQM